MLESAATRCDTDVGHTSDIHPLPSTRLTVVVVCFQDSPPWVLRAEHGFSGALIDAWGNPALFLSGKCRKPLLISSPAGVQMTSMSQTYK